MLRLSKYTLFKQDEEKYLLFNAFSNAFIGVEFDDITQKDIMNDLIGGRTIPRNKCPESFSTLIEQGIVTNLNPEDEERLFENNFYSNYFLDNVPSITLAPSLSCNLNCNYCYQSGDNQELINTLPKADWASTAYEFAKNFIDSRNLQRVTFVWFGGEPLLSHKPLREFSRNIKKYYANKPVKIEFEVITNGTIINEDILADFTELPIKFAQITIDGPEESHNMIRHYKDGRGTYESIVANLTKILKQTSVNVSIRYNLCSENSAALYYKNLTSHITKDFSAFIDNRRLRIEYPVLATDTCLYKNTVSLKQYTDSFIGYLKTLSAAGVAKDKIFKYAPPFCTARNNNGLVIGPGGDIYKCWEHIGNQEYVVGNTSEGWVKIKENEWKVIGSNSYHPKCLKCKLLPLCLGGCPLNWGRNKSEPECPVFMKPEIFWDILKFTHGIDN